ncbi:MAG: hypothetical protein C0614_07390 [Desulfuromonas sp.]|nr:MAG: hypothetical protein C0614_07390 [Desulfuromonas sp.]
MVPDRLLAVTEIPLNRHGKLDLVRLQYTLPSADQPPHDPLNTECEFLIADLFAEILGISVTSRTADFFEMGGNSLKALRLLTQLRETFSDLTPALLYAHSRVGELANILKQGSRTFYSVYPGTDCSTVDIFLFPSIDSLYAPVNSRIAKALTGHHLVCFDFSAEGFIDRCTAVVKARQHHDRATLFLGYSGGGNFAWEVASRLGEQAPQALVMLDSWVMAEKPSAEEYLRWIGQHYANIDGLPDQTALHAYIEALPSGLGEETIPSRIVLISSADHEPPDGIMHRHWGGKTRGEFTVVPGVGNHFEMCRPEFLDNNIHLARRIIDGLSPT